MLKDLIQRMIKDNEFYTLFNATCDFLDFKNTCNSKVEYFLAVVEKVKNIISCMKDCKSD